MERTDTIEKFIRDQLSRWPLACGNFRALKSVQVRTFEIGGLNVKLQYNPARIVSSAADTAPEAIRERQCFLCPENRPEVQISLRFDGRKGKKYDILVNPYPIFPSHLVVAMNVHVPQKIGGRYVDILDLSKAFQNYTFFYNGPKCGASAPDHHHFQAAVRGMMPLEADVDAMLEKVLAAKDEAQELRAEAAGLGGVLDYMSSIQDAHLFQYRKFLRGIFVLKARTPKSAAKLFYRLLDCAKVPEGDVEPRFNMISWYRSGEFRTIVIFRTQHRSHHYFSEGEDHLTMSPGCADMGGMLIAPKKEEFDRLDGNLLEEMLSEVTLDREQEEDIVWKLTRKQKKVSVGIMSAPAIEFSILADSAGRQKALYREGRIDYNGALYDELVFDSRTPSTMFAEASFQLYGVPIGKGFHWERKEDQKFAGSLRIVVDQENLVAINDIGIEDYLLSVISSEMRSTSSLEFLKAHAVISRSWVMARTESRRSGSEGQRGGPEERWYDHEDHSLFDVCADDHCQRYQGLTRASGDAVRKAVDDTWGQVLSYDGAICDARFSKCCGGVTEKFSSCWENKDYPYLPALPDSPGHDPEARPFCDTDDRATLSQVLNSYDLETPDFFRWTEKRSREELAECIEKRSGRKIGRLIALRPLLRGESGRIVKLRIEGSEASFNVGKELEIRRMLSSTHLKSSAFELEDKGEEIVFHGRGWGHGVGLCQIGAAVMASRGYDYRAILLHYYPGTEIAVK